MKSLVTGMVLTAAAALTAPLDAQQHPATPQPHTAGARAPAMAHMHTMDSLGARLDSAVARMNRATGEARTPAMQDVLRELATAHRAMRTHMTEMHRHMSEMMATHHPMADSAAMRTPMQHQHPTPDAARPDSVSRPRR